MIIIRVANLNSVKLYTHMCWPTGQGIKAAQKMYRRLKYPSIKRIHVLNTQFDGWASLPKIHSTSFLHF